jgi:selenocysteine-specific elongation factor
MVAGAVGIDMVMLVIAADDGVMPQTREHLDIMSILGIRRGFIVITKIDMVDPEFVELVREEVAEFVEGTFLEGSPIVTCSSITGEGLPEVRSHIDALVRSLPDRPREGVFRMPIQRAFTLKGHGTVVTGVALSGVAQVGDSLEVLPKGLACRVRAIHVHHRPATEALAGHRSAFNLTDVDYRNVARGDVLATPGYFTATKLVEARFTLLKSFKGPLKDQAAIRFHVGSSDCLGRMVLLNVKALNPGEDALVQFRLDDQVVVAPGDHYLVRLASPEKSLGGGLVLGETRFRFKRFRDWIQQNMAGKEQSLRDSTRYLEYVVRSEGLHPVSIDTLPLLVKDDPAAVKSRVQELVASGTLSEISGGRELIHRDMVDRGALEAQDALLQLHEKDHYPFGFSVQAIASAMKHLPRVAQLFVEQALAERKLERQGDLFRHKSFKGSLSNEDRKLIGIIEERLQTSGFSAPLASGMAEELGKPRKRIDNLLVLLEGAGRAVRLEDGLYVHMDSVKGARDKLVSYCLQNEEMPSNVMKDVIGASRKYVIPLLEYFDKVGLTVRKDSSRTLTSGYENVLV